MRLLLLAEFIAWVIAGSMTVIVMAALVTEVVGPICA